MTSWAAAALGRQPRIAADDDPDGADDMPVSWERIPLGPALAGELETPTPTIFRLENQQALFYAAAVNSTHGESGIGKSWLIASVIAQLVKAGRKVLFIDYEDTEATLITRLLALGVSRELVEEKVIYIRPQDPVTEVVVDQLCHLIEVEEIAYAAIDSVGEALAVEGLNEDRDNEVGPWMRMLPRRLADAGAAVHLTDHSTKANDNPLQPSGSKRKRAAVTGASYFVEVDQPLVKSTGGDPAEGRLKLICAKDRHGTYARGQLAATFTLTAYPDEGVTAHLWPVMPSERCDSNLGHQLVAREAVRAAKAHGEPLSQRALVGMMTKVKASTEAKRTGIEVALAQGALAESSGPRNARMLAYVTDLASGGCR